MKDKNLVILEGTVGDNYQYLKTRDGKEFATFTLYVNSLSKDYKDTTEAALYVDIRIMVFDNKLVEYLKEMKPHNGTHVSIFGRLNSHNNTYKGISFRQNDVVVRDIHVIKTK